MLMFAIQRTCGIFGAPFLLAFSLCPRALGAKVIHFTHACVLGTTPSLKQFARVRQRGEIGFLPQTYTNVICGGRTANNHSHTHTHAHTHRRFCALQSCTPAKSWSQRLRHSGRTEQRTGAGGFEQRACTCISLRMRAGLYVLPSVSATPIPFPPAPSRRFLCVRVHVSGCRSLRCASHTHTHSSHFHKNVSRRRRRRHRCSRTHICFI